MDIKESHELRWGGMAGIGALVVGLIGRLVMGNAPSISDSTTTIAGYLAAYRTQILTAALLFAVALMLFLWFGVALATAFRRADESSDTPALVLAGFVVVTVIGFIGVAVFAGMTYAMVANPPLLAIAAGPYTALTVMGGIAGVAMAATFAAVAAAILHTKVFPKWMAWFAIAVAAIRLLAAAMVGNTGGVLAPDGPLVVILPGLLTAAWVLVASWLLIREHLPLPSAGAKPVMGH
ncbi:hypothetical protein ACFXJ8_07720 [Nonomuraea sp. NPDC059194]|uniref:hypothetical protein n=1 Tax=Nonomuraea sp. NPDC059194 TaxID=3346764 RepID=UPI0036B27952